LPASQLCESKLCCFCCPAAQRLQELSELCGKRVEPGAVLTNSLEGLKPLCGVNPLYQTRLQASSVAKSE
jgi:hypothetical protein